MGLFYLDSIKIGLLFGSLVVCSVLDGTAYLHVVCPGGGSKNNTGEVKKSIATSAKPGASQGLVYIIQLYFFILSIFL